jgi:hypothetical protein
MPVAFRTPVQSRFKSPIKELAARPAAYVRSLRELTARERQFLTNEIEQVRGLMPLLMKPRNGQRWTPEEKRELVAHVRRLSSISRYLVLLVMPGGMLILPVLSWWLDRRRSRNRPGPPVSR